MDHILLLIAQPEPCLLLKTLLQPRYAVLVPEPAPAASETLVTAALHKQVFDCCIADVASLQQIAEPLRQRKASAAPVFLPLLLCTGEHGQVPAPLWDLADEVLRLPLEPWEVQKRVAALLRERHRSGMLAQSNSLLNQEITRRRLLQQELAQVSPMPVQQEAVLVEHAVSPALQPAAGANHGTTSSHTPDMALGEAWDHTSTIVAESLDVILVIDGEHGRILDVNPAVLPMLGYTPEMLVGQHFSALFPMSVPIAPGDALGNLQTHGAVFASQAFRRADGSICPMDMTATIIPWGTGRAVLVGLRDVTERQQAEKAQAQLAAIVQSSDDAIISKALDGTLLSWNRGAEHIYGYTADEAIGQHGSLLVPPGHQQELPVLLGRIREGESISHHETVRQRKDGTLIHVALTISPIRDTAGAIVGASVIARDITRRKQMENDLVESKARLHHILNNNPLGILVIDKEGVVRYANPAAQHLRSDSNMREQLLDTSTSQQRINEVQVVRQDGTIVTLEMHITKSTWEDQPAYVISLLDITERKAAEEALCKINDELEARVSERTYELLQTNASLQTEIEQRKKAEHALITAQARLQHLLVSSPVVIFTCQPHAPYGATFISENFTTIFGYQPHAFTEDAHFWANHIHPDDAPRVFEQLPCLFEQGYHAHDYRFLRHDGIYRWVYNQLKLVQDADGNLIEIVGSIQDITERKEAEEALKHARDKLEDRVQERTLMLQYSVQRALKEIGERQRAEAEALRQANRAEALLRVAAHLNAQLDMETLLEDVCRETIKALNVATATVLLHDETRQVLYPAANVGTSGALLKQAMSLSIADYEDHVQNYGAVPVILDWQAHPEYPDYALCVRLNIRTSASSRMIYNGTLIGVLAIATVGEVRHLTSDELALLQGLADQAALAIVNARQFQALEESKSLLEQRIAEATSDLRRANDELARAARLKDEFMAGMSHELRTPLNAILGMSEILQEGIYGPLTEKQQRSLRTIEESGRHLLALINDILDISKIQAGKIELEIRPVSVESLCETSMRLIKQAAHKKALQVFTRIETESVLLPADERRLKQILVNLLSNAVKFTPEKGQIGLDVHTDEQMLSFTIWDTGIGIAPDDLQRLFQPFVQVDSSLSRMYEGTGLGLALVAELTQLHGGLVAVESEVGKGSRFTVSLPLRAEPEDEQERTQAGAAVGVPSPANVPLLADEHEPDLGRWGAVAATILLAEDNQTNIDTLLDYLQMRNYRIVLARNGHEALEMARQLRPALILMDIQMPVMDGLEAMRHIRADSSLAHIPIIALTGLAMSGDRERCLQAGANDYLSKPVSLRELVRAIERQLAVL